MSLSSHINSADSPVRALLARCLGATGPVVKEAAALLRGDHPRAPLAAAVDVNPGRAGTAVDYLLRFALAAEPCPPHSAARAGAGMLGDASVSAVYAVEDALERVAAVAPSRRDVSDEEWLELTEISLVLATFEAVYRSRIVPPLVAQLDRVPADWRAWARLVCEEAEVEDVALLGWAAAEDHADLRGRRLRCNPTFAQSRALGGADADVLTERGTLLDFKSTGTARVCSRSDVWQLCGYALADTHDALRITAVGLSALRWRSRVTWPLTELLEQLAGGPVDLPALRRDFAAVLVERHRPRPRLVPRAAD